MEVGRGGGVRGSCSLRGAVFAFGPGVGTPPNTVPISAPGGGDNPVLPAKEKPKGEWIPKIQLIDGVLEDMPKSVAWVDAPPSAFPELKLPEREAGDSFGTKYDTAMSKRCPRVLGKTALVIEPTDGTLEKLLKARLQRGIIQWLRHREILRTGLLTANFTTEIVEGLTDMEAVCQELWGGQPKELISWLEELVITAKELELFQLALRSAKTFRRTASISRSGTDCVPKRRCGRPRAGSEIPARTGNAGADRFPHFSVWHVAARGSGWVHDPFARSRPSRHVASSVVSPALIRAPLAADHIPDAELLRRFVAVNDSAAFELIVRRHADAVWAATFRILKTESDAEDAFQATFLALIRKARAVRTPCVGGWLYRVAVNAALKLRARTARTALAEPDRLNAIPATNRTGPDAELIAAVHEELARLPERERLPVMLCDLEGLSHADAAKALGWPVGTVSGRLSRARAKLRTLLERRGLAPSAALLPILIAPPHRIPNALSLTAGAASPAVVALAEGVLAMTSPTWKWVAMAVVCSGALGARAVFAFGPGVKPLPPNVATATVPVAADNPDPPAKDKPAEECVPTQLIPKIIVAEPFQTHRPAAKPRFPRSPLRNSSRTRIGREKHTAAFEKFCPRLAGKIVFKVDPTDDAYRKVLKGGCIKTWSSCRIREVIRIGTWNATLFLDVYDCLADMEATVIELWGAQPKELIPWLEELVYVTKEYELFTYIRVTNGNDPPQRLNAASFHRLRAEAALLKAKKRA